MSPGSESSFTGSASGSCHRLKSLTTGVTREADSGASGAVDPRRTWMGLPVNVRVAAPAHSKAHRLNMRQLAGTRLSV